MPLSIFKDSVQNTTSEQSILRYKKVKKYKKMFPDADLAEIIGAFPALEPKIIETLVKS